MRRPVRQLIAIASLTTTLLAPSFAPADAVAAAGGRLQAIRSVSFGAGLSASAGAAPTADVWRTRGSTGRPVAILVHGGGWRTGTRRQWEWNGWAQSLARAGFVVVAPSYRLACERGAGPLCGARMPDARTDVVAAVGWTRRNAARYGGRPDRMFLVGGSSGAHLALLASVHPDARAGISGVVAISPPADLAAIGRQSQHLDANVQLSIGCSWVRCPRAWRNHSPIEVLARHRRLPPVYAYASRRDPRVRRADVGRFVRRMRHLRAPVVLREPRLQTSGCHGPWACGRLRVAGTNVLLKWDVIRWMRARPAR